jgi:hypothetical protein
MSTKKKKDATSSKKEIVNKKKKKKKTKTDDGIAQRTRTHYPGEWTHKWTEESKEILDNPHAFGFYTQDEHIALAERCTALETYVQDLEEQNEAYKTRNDQLQAELFQWRLVPSQPTTLSSTAVAQTQTETKSVQQPSIVSSSSPPPPTTTVITQMTDDNPAIDKRPVTTRIHPCNPSFDGIYPCCGQSFISLSVNNGCTQRSIWA